MPNKLLLQAAISQLVVIDMQVKLAPAMDFASMQAVTKNCAILLQAAHLLQVPTIVTEQYSQGLGETIPELKQHFLHIKPIAKTAFSACAEPAFKQHCHSDKPQIVLTGMEAHICVLQTALDLVQAGKQVFVVEDAMISRNNSNQIGANKANAIARLRDAGCVITNTESVLFEWLGNANHESFKVISKLIK
jgi:nicotinamidase-related amidase